MLNGSGDLSITESDVVDGIQITSIGADLAIYWIVVSLRLLKQIKSST